MMVEPLKIESRIESVSVLIVKPDTESVFVCRCCKQTIAEAFHPPRTALTLSELRVELIRCWNARRSIWGLPLIDDEGFEK